MLLAVQIAVHVEREVSVVKSFTRFQLGPSDVDVSTLHPHKKLYARL